MAPGVARNLSQRKPGTLVVGIDLALDENVVEVMAEQAQCLAKFRFPNTQDGYTFLRQRLTSLCQSHAASGVLVGMEPTNFFWKLLATDLEQHDIAYCLVNPLTVHRHREGDQLDQSRDDPRDAHTIANLVRTGTFTQTHLLHGRYADLRAAVTVCHQLQCDVTRQQTIISALAGQLFPELTSVFHDLTGETALALLSAQGAAAVIKTMSLAEFAAVVRRNMSGQRLMVSKVRQSYDLAATSVGLRDGLPGLQVALRAHIAVLRVLRTQLAVAEQEVMTTFLTLPEAPYLQSLPGLGIMTAAVILAEIGDPHLYRSGHQLVKLAGIQPAPDTSGRKKHSLTPMSHHGRPRLRTALYFACLRLIQCDDAFAQCYRSYQERATRPLSKMAALGAVMNKLVRILWALMHHHVLYSPSLTPVT